MSVPSNWLYKVLYMCIWVVDGCAVYWCVMRWVWCPVSMVSYRHDVRCPSGCCWLFQVCLWDLGAAAGQAAALHTVPSRLAIAATFSRQGETRPACYALHPVFPTYFCFLYMFSFFPTYSSFPLTYSGLLFYGLTYSGWYAIYLILCSHGIWQ